MKKIMMGIIFGCPFILFADLVCGRTLNGQLIAGQKEMEYRRKQGLIKTFPAEGPKAIWRVNLGDGYSGISISGGRIYTMFAHR